MSCLHYCIVSSVLSVRLLRMTSCIDIQVIELAYKQFDHLKRNIFLVNIHISTQSQFNVLSGGLTECLVEPRHVGVSTAGSLLTRTLLSIPQWIIGVECRESTALFIIVTSLTVVVTTNKRRQITYIVFATGTIISEICCMHKIQSISVRPNVLARSTTVCDGYSINIYTVNC